MSAFVSATGRGEPCVEYYPELNNDGEPVVVVRIGGTSIHLDPPAAARLAADILRALPAEPDWISGATDGAIVDCRPADAEARGDVS